MHETLQHSDMEPVSCSNSELIQEVVRDIDAAPPNVSGARELRDILTDPNFCVCINYKQFSNKLSPHGLTLDADSGLKLKS